MEPMTHVNPLEYATTKDLLNAISKRFDNMIFIGHALHQEGFDADNQPRPMDVERWRWKGDIRKCQGLAFTLAKRMSDLCDSELQLIDPDEV